MNDLPPGAVADETVRLRRELAEARADLAEARVRAAEGAHRSRNAYAVMGALIRRVLAEAGSVEGARAALERIPIRLAAGHDVGFGPAPGNESERELGGLARAILAGFAPDGAAVPAGPAAVLAPRAHRLMALLLFELGTNAVKHGSLGLPGGAVELSWCTTPDGGLDLVWNERGGVAGGPAGVPSGPPGGGAKLFQALRDELGATVDHLEGEAGRRIEILLPPGALERRAGATGPRAGPSRVLVVEDSPLIASDLAWLLQEAGAREVTIAATLSQALSHLAAGGFDLVLLDVELQGERSDPAVAAAAPARVVVVTGREPEGLPAAFAGAPLLRKPFGADDIAGILNGN